MHPLPPWWKQIVNLLFAFGHIFPVTIAHGYVVNHQYTLNSLGLFTPIMDQQFQHRLWCDIFFKERKGHTSSLCKCLNWYRELGSAS